MAHLLPLARWESSTIRRHLRARLDALYFHLYGLTRKDAEYVLDTFLIVRREDEAAFSDYRTHDMTLAYMNALAALDRMRVTRYNTLGMTGPLDEAASIQRLH